MRFPLILAAVLCLFAASRTVDCQEDRDLIQPKLRKAPSLSIPDEAKASGIGGRVRVLAILDKLGNVKSVERIVGPGAVCPGVTRPDVVALRNIAKEAAFKTIFEPATKKGKPVESSSWITFNFPEKPNDPGENYSAASGGDEAGASTTPKQIRGGVVNGRALSLPRPQYPASAHAAGAAGTVEVQLLIDEEGTVFSAEVVSGHPLLRAATIQVACQAKFSPTSLVGHPVKVSGIVTYNFIL